MTITTMAPAPASTTADWELAERVSRHMQTHFPDTTAAASWTVARDERDNTAVVVAGPGDDPTMPGGSYGIHAYRWMCSLRDAGFTAEARTDMEVFGRPDEQAPDGRARWLHITSWSKPLPVPPEKRGFVVPGPREHFVSVTPGSTPKLFSVGAQGPDTVWGFRFSYYKGRLTIAVDFEHSCWRLLGEPPEWVLDIARAHKSCSTEKRCRPGDEAVAS